jgi:hypothetical protein
MARLVWLPGLLLALGVSAADGDPRHAEALDSAVLAVMETQPAEPAAEPIVIEQAPRERRELGAVIDAQPEDGGLPRVMAVTRGGAADRMGMRAGDRLLRINGGELNAGADAASQLRTAVDASDAPLQLLVQRGSEQLALSGQPDRVEIPAYRLEIAPPPPSAGCGRVSVVVLPPRSEDLYPLLLHEVDGRLPGPLSNEVFRLSAGRHVLKVSELIDSRRFSGFENVERGRLDRWERFKYLEIDIEPNTHYRLGVQFFDDRRDPISKQAYWEPVVWKQFGETCR